MPPYNPSGEPWFVACRPTSTWHISPALPGCISQWPRRLFAEEQAGVLAGALATAALVAWTLRHSTAGFAIRTVGVHPDAARYAGIHVGGHIVLTLTLAGGLAGLAGAGEVLGVHHTLPATFVSGDGFDAIAVALLARSHPLGVVPAALLWGGLRNGAGLMQV